MDVLVNVDSGCFYAYVINVVAACLAPAWQRCCGRLLRNRQWSRT